MERTKETLTWQEYQAGLGYQMQMGFTAKWPEYVRFHDYDQWPRVTEATKQIPRPVHNIVEYIVRMKTANVLSQSMKMQFMPEEIGEDSPYVEKIARASEDFTDFAAHTWYDIGQDNLNTLAVQDSAMLGPGIWHYYWDNSVVGGTVNKYRGKLAGEVIDPLCVFFGNPQCVDVQKQPYVLIASREDTGLLKEYAKAEGLKQDDIDNIAPDDGTDIEKYDAETKTLDGSKKTTVLTRYHRIKGEVYMSKSTKNVDLIKDRRMNGNTRYPVEVFRWKNKKRCIYGMGEIEGLIPSQKTINLISGMTAQALTLMGFPKMIVYEGALDSDPKNTVGEVIKNLLGDPNAVKYLDPPQINNAVFALVDGYINQARTLSGATEVMGGDRITSGMAASAVMAIQAQNRMPIGYIQQTLYRSIQNIGRIWEEFFKNYQTMPRPMVVRDTVGGKHTKVFTGSEYADVSFDLKVEVGPSSQFSEMLSQTTLDMMYNKGDIDIDDYLATAPQNVVPFAEELKRRRESKLMQSSVIGEMMATGELNPISFAKLADAGFIPQSIAAQLAEVIPPPEAMLQPEEPAM